MLFCSLQFVGFFLAVFLLYWVIPSQRFRNLLVVAASMAFYATWNWMLALLVCGAAVFSYAIGRGMDRATSASARRGLLVLSLVANLGLLSYFKYANFFIASASHLLDMVGFHSSPLVLQVILPVGISFYTFEAINYAVDVYMRRAAAEKSLPNLMLFILFFPHLIAGPIVRAKDFLPQLRQQKHFSWPRMQLGIEFFLMGLFKKMVIADRMAEYANPVFAQPSAYATSAVWVGILAYALQIYCDFSGYTDMAIGCAHMLGYKLPQNFNLPYAARNVSEFWRRWHMSLSTWLRDYLYIPLGGNRHGRARTLINLMLTMLLGGLWHGAAWTFVIWGGLHGLYLVIHKLFADAFKESQPMQAALESPPGIVLRMALTLLAVCVGWVFFRCTTLAGAIATLRVAFVPQAGLGCPLPMTSFLTITTLVVVAHFLTYKKQGRQLLRRLPAPLAGAGYALALCLALLLAPGATKAFIYFQF